MGNWSKIIVATEFEWLPKVQTIAQSGHTDCNNQDHCPLLATGEPLFWTFLAGIIRHNRKSETVALFLSRWHETTCCDVAWDAEQQK